MLIYHSPCFAQYYIIVKTWNENIWIVSNLLHILRKIKFEKIHASRTANNIPIINPLLSSGLFKLRLTVHLMFVTSKDRVNWYKKKPTFTNQRLLKNQIIIDIHIRTFIWMATSYTRLLFSTAASLYLKNKREIPIGFKHFNCTNTLNL